MFSSFTTDQKSRFRNRIIVVVSLVAVIAYIEFQSLFLSNGSHVDYIQEQYSGTMVSFEEARKLSRKLNKFHSKEPHLIKLNAFNHCSVNFGDTASFCYIFPPIDNAKQNENSNIILVSILSNAINFEQRQWIRDTWFNYKKNINFKPYFIVANPMTAEKNNNTVDWTIVYRLQTEFLQFGDIIMLRTNEGYKVVLPYKSLGSFQIFENEFKNTNWNVIGIFKTDDDSYVRMNAIKRKIDALTNNANNHKMDNRVFFYAGECVFHFKIRAKQRTGTKNPVPWDVWPYEYYPDFCKGPGYILSWDLINCVNSKVKNKDDFFPFYVEDVSTGIYVEKCHGNATNIQQYPELDVMENYENDRNNFKNRFVFHHVTTKEQFQTFWNWENALS